MAKGARGAHGAEGSAQGFDSVFGLEQRSAVVGDHSEKQGGAGGRRGGIAWSGLGVWLGCRVTLR